MTCCKCKMQYPMAAMLCLTGSGEKKWLCINCWDEVVKKINEKEK